jgi:DnaD/phage-associated family protein
MNDATLKLSPPEAAAIPLRDIEILLAAGNGDAALLYLHILRNGGVLDSAAAATELHRSDRDIRETAERLCQMGILQGSAGAAPAAREKAPARDKTQARDNALPEYQAQDVVRRSMESPAFQTLVEEVQKSLGRILNTAELKKLFGIHSDLAMPTEVILLLVQHCREEFGGNVGFRAIEREASDWFQREILTYEQAEQWLGRLQERKSVISQFQRQLKIESLSPTAQSYLKQWMDMGYGLEELVIAGDRTMTQTGRLHWKYMDSIVRSWDKKGLHTAQEIEKGDQRPSRGTRYEPTPAAPQDDSKTLEQMARLQEKMKNS